MERSLLGVDSLTQSRSSSMSSSPAEPFAFPHIASLCGPVSGKCELKTLDAVAASRVACAGPMLSAGGRALLD